MQRISPPSTTFGSKIAIAAPASKLDPKILQLGAELLSSWGYAVEYDERVKNISYFHAGSDLERADVLLRLLRDPALSAIWCARGGYGVTRILPLLDKANAHLSLRQKPKIIVGYSDITALHIWAWKRAKLKSLHSPLIATPKWLKIKPATRKVLQDLLAGRARIGKNSHTATWPTRFLSYRKSVEGIILGGNLSLLASLSGTPWEVSFQGALLFIEDCAEAPYRIDRMLTQLRNCGSLKGVRGVLVGDLTADAPPRQRGTPTWKDVLRRNFPDVPVLVGLPVGHGSRNEPLPLGVRAKITLTGKLEILEQLVRSPTTT